jgi:serine/threonine protein kinase
MECRIAPAETPGHFVLRFVPQTGTSPGQPFLSDTSITNFHKQAPEGHMLWQIDPKYEISELLGCGVYGTVCRGRNRDTGQVVAIKRVCMAQVCQASFALLYFG